MAEVATFPAEKVLSFIQGGELVDITEVAEKNPELLARTVLYSLGRTYHRERLCKAILSLMTYSTHSTYRNVAWATIQKIPLTHILHLIDVMDKKENTRRLRMAVAVKIANSSEKEIIRAYFLAPSKFRKLFSYLYLPRDRVDNHEIKNSSYLLARRLATLPTSEVMDELGITPSDLVKKYGIPLHMVLQWVENPEQAHELAETSNPHDYLRHARWFRAIMGDEDYSEITIKKIDRIKDPFSFLSIRDHLEATGALTQQLISKLDRRAEKVIEKITENAKLERIALLVDVSGSMQTAIEITSKLYEAFSKMKVVADIIAFRHNAFITTHEELKQLEPSGMTSIGSAIVLLAKQLKQQNENPQAIIIVSDMEENTRPYLRDTVSLLDEFGRPPLIILQCGGHGMPSYDYPYAVIGVEDFHPRLLKDIIANIVRLTSKAVKEKKITEAVKERRLLDEELGEIELPQRPKESLRPGYLRKVLCE